MGIMVAPLSFQKILGYTCNFPRIVKFFKDGVIGLTATFSTFEYERVACYIVYELGYGRTENRLQNVLCL